MSIKLPFISVNGVPAASISPLDRGFAYGDGLFETCRYHSGGVPLWNLHYERLQKSAVRLGIPLDEALLNTYLSGAVHQLEADLVAHAVVKIQITRGEGGRGYRPPDNPNPTYVIGAFAAEPLQSNNYRFGVDIRVCHQRLSRSTVLAGMKHLNRLEHILARAEWHDEFAEGLLLDESGRVIEATVSNLFVVKNQQLFTPDLSQCGVAGVMRRLILDEIAPRLAIKTNISQMDLDFVSEADELLLCNSVYGIWPVNRLVDNRSASHSVAEFTSHAVARQLQAQIERTFSKDDV